MCQFNQALPFNRLHFHSSNRPADKNKDEVGVGNTKLNIASFN